MEATKQAKSMADQIVKSAKHWDNDFMDRYSENMYATGDSSMEMSAYILDLTDDFHLHVTFEDGGYSKSFILHKTEFADNGIY